MKPYQFLGVMVLTASLLFVPSMGAAESPAVAVPKAAGKAIEGAATNASAPASATEPGSAKSVAPQISQEEAYFVLLGTIGFMLGGLFFAARAMISSQRRPGAREWRFVEALSEEVTLADADGKLVPVLVASSSRLIAVFGMIVILSLYLGVGLVVLWGVARTGSTPTGLDSVMKFMAAGGTLFAPYLFNQIRAGFEKKTSPTAETGGAAPPLVKAPPVKPGMTV